MQTAQQVDVRVVKHDSPFFCLVMNEEFKADTFGELITMLNNRASELREYLQYEADEDEEAYVGKKLNMLNAKINELKLCLQPNSKS